MFRYVIILSVDFNDFNIKPRTLRITNQKIQGEDKMKECNFCQFENPNDALRCERCGKILDVVVCPDCRKENAIGSTICELCGKDLNKPDHDNREIEEKRSAETQVESSLSQKGNDESVNSDTSDNNSRTQNHKKGDWGPAIAGFSIGVPIAIIMIASRSEFSEIIECSGTSFSIAAMLFIVLRKFIRWLSQRASSD